MTWQIQANSLMTGIDAALNRDKQVQLIARELQRTYEQGVDEGIKMGIVMRKRND